MSTATIPTLTLRPHQVTNKHLVHDKFREGFRMVVDTMPTGAGKRYSGVDWAMQATKQGRYTLIVTDRRLLVRQMGEELTRFGVPYGIIMAEYHEERQHLVQVASIQTLESRYLDKLEELPPADLILIDEAHKASEAYVKLLAHYPEAKVIGLTATPVGAKGTSLVPSMFQVMVEGCRNSELIAGGLLLPTTIIAPSEPNIKGIRVGSSGDYSQQKLGKAVQGVTAFADVFIEWMPFADRKTIVFAPSVAYAKGLAYGLGGELDSFNARGIRAEVIEAATKTKDRERIFDDFEHGDLKVLVSVDVLKEGFDAPIASCGIDLQPTAQLRTYWQKVGRVKRAHPGQSEAIWIDMAGNCWRFPHPDDDPDWHAVNDKVSTQDWIQEQKDNGKLPQPIRCSQCGTIRKGGPKCPSCGHEAGPKDNVRLMRMGNGKLKKVSAEHIRKHQKTEHEKKLANWKSQLIVGMKCGRTLSQCAILYRHKYGEMPPNGAPCMPERGSQDWKRRVSSLYRMPDIMARFNT